MPNPIILIHGYSDRGESFETWRRALMAQGYDATTISTCSYVSLSNEVSIKDIAEGFDRALRLKAGLNANEPFDALVHSTGMLVIRSWLANYPDRIGRLKHLLAIAPATFGSPLAHKGRSWLGAIFKGNKTFGPDFMEAGDEVLDGLELGSRFTWDLAHKDLLGEDTFYGPTKRTPYVFVFCGTKAYGGLRRLVNEPGTDGTVRWAGCALNTRKIVLDLTRPPGQAKEKARIQVQPWTQVDVPTVFVEGLNHGTILGEPSEALVSLALAALKVSSADAFAAWQTQAANRTRQARESVDPWQQFVIHAVDERGDPIHDFNVQLFSFNKSGKAREMVDFDLDVHTYQRDPSYRCFHVNLSRLKPEKLENLGMRVIASTGSKLIGYQGYGSAANEIEEVNLDLTPLLRNTEVTLFYPFTTTLVELVLNREPLPLEGRNNVLWFLS